MYFVNLSIGVGIAGLLLACYSTVLSGAELKEPVTAFHEISVPASSSATVHLKLIGRWPAHMRGSVACVRVVGRLVYAVMKNTGLVIYEISPTGTIAQKGVCALGGGGQGVGVEGRWACVGMDTAGLAIVDVSDPEKPVEVGRLSDIRHAGQVVVSGGIAFVTDSTNGVQLVNLKEPANPVRLGTCRTRGRAVSIFVAGSLAYISASRLEIWDIKNPANPVLIGIHDPEADCNGTQVLGGLAFMASGNHGLRVADVSNPKRPQPLGNTGKETIGYSEEAWLAGRFVYLASQRLNVINVEDPRSPLIVATLNEGPYQTVSGAGRWLVAAGSSALHVYDISQPANPVRVSEMAVDGDVQDMRIEGNFVFLADGTSFQVLDVSRPSQPISVARADIPGYAICVAVAGKYAYVGDTYCPNGIEIRSSGQGADKNGPPHGLQIFDISRPNAPVKVNRWSLTGHNHVTSLLVTSNLVYWTDQTVRIVDVSDPTQPKFLPASLEERTRLFGGCLQGNILYNICEWKGLRIYDVKNPKAPTLLGKYPLDNSSPQDCPLGYGGYVDVADARAYVGADAMLHILDVSDPSKPRHLGHVRAEGMVVSLQVVNNRVFLADEEGVKVFDVSDPIRPVLVGQHVLKGFSRSIRVAGGRVYVSEAGELLIFEITN